MKTAISLPDELFRQAEAAARKMRVSRSQLYATAIAEFLERRLTSKITRRLDAIYGQNAAGLDPGLYGAQLKSIGKEDW